MTTSTPIKIEPPIRQERQDSSSKTLSSMLSPFHKNDAVVGIELLYIEEPQEFSYKRLLKPRYKSQITYTSWHYSRLR